VQVITRSRRSIIHSGSRSDKMQAIAVVQDKGGLR
jgi:hypothetical protein